MKTHESTHLLFKILRSTDSYEGESRLYSHTSMGSQPQPAAWPGLQFLARDIGVAESAATFNEDLKLGAVVRWRVLRGKEISEGQHQVTLTQLGSPVTWPQYGDVPPPPLPAIPEITPELAAAQTLVCHSLRHAPSKQHDFKKTRLCVIPVQLLLQNCSDFPLQVTVNTNDTPSGGVVRSTQLYSPHASASLCFLGPSCRLLALAPRGNASVGLSAALPRPGTYDLARRLSVSCRQGDSKDSTVQAWRSPSPFIITQV
ncbi:hypothetical protein B566_EDAN012240 [Ephemera danica]|nr:hypothetical protein B566_EDAN012240 [Ephemera danica]